MIRVSSNNNCLIGIMGNLKFREYVSQLTIRRDNRDQKLFVDEVLDSFYQSWNVVAKAR